MSISLSTSPHLLLSTPNHLPKPPFKKPFSSVRSSSSSPPSTSFDLRSYWTTLLPQINSHLDSLLPVRYPDTIFLSMRHSLLSPSAKRAPPIMSIAAFDLLTDGAVPLSVALPTAAALEMVHTASLIHDDLPSFDSSPIRRGLPSNHSLFGVDMAVLAGDALFPLAFHHLVTSTPSHLVPPETILKIVQEISRTVGSTGMASGQFLDFDADVVNEEDEAMLVLEKKFGLMAECSAVCGGLVGGAGEEVVEGLRRYGRAVGVLYQLVDDVSMEAGNGGSGKMRSNVSVVKAVGMERAMEIVEELRGKAKAEVRALGERFGEERVLAMGSFVDYAVERGFVIEENQAVAASFPL